MTRDRLIRILCVALVTAVLSLALILTVAVIGGLTAEGEPKETTPHYRPDLPEGTPDMGPWEPEIPTRDPDGTLPFDPDMTLPDWESGFEWPTLPPSLETDPDFEWPTLPEEWDTLPEEWDTLPPEWGDMVSPEDVADLIAGVDGSLGLPAGALAAGVASQLTVMEIYAEHTDSLYLKMRSFGDYTGQGWGDAISYDVTVGPRGYSVAYLPYYLMNGIKPFGGYSLTITPMMDTRVIPYYLTPAGGYAQMQTGDIMATGPTDSPYTLHYRPYGDYMSVAESFTRDEAAYYAYVQDHYLYVDDTTAAYLRLIIEEQGFDRNDPDIVGKVADYIQNSAAYNPAYDRNLDSEPNVALAFLGAYKEGVCRHYATAATLLYRALGIPARYTVGFAADVRAGETTAVKGMDAHAWVEVYEKGFGWRFVEVTGSSAGGPSVPPDTDTETAPDTEPDTEGEIPKITLILRPADMTVPFEGKFVEHNGILEGFEAFEERGFTYTATVRGKAVKFGYTAAEIESLTLYNADGADVTDLFDVTREAGVIHLYLAELTFTSTGGAYVYDGAPHRTSGVTLSEGILPQRYFLEWTPVGEQVTVGVSPAAYALTVWYDGGDGVPEDRTSHFLIHKQYGTLTVTPAPLTLKAADAEKVYDGEALTARGIGIIGGALAEGDFIDSYTVEGAQTRVGRSENIITAVVIRNKDGEDVTRSYAIDTVAGTLRVLPP